MSINDLILLSILSTEKELTLSKIVNEFRKVEMKKLPSRTGIYSRLKILSLKQLVETSWAEGKKLYKSSEIGKNTVEQFKTNLNQFN